ncbi:MAG TPA: hypothetical protein VFG30_10975, partial [Polyangiales bacterium]|nr:hypothetical protein [Polyangiales bacterium]
DPALKPTPPDPALKPTPPDPARVPTPPDPARTPDPAPDSGIEFRPAALIAPPRPADCSSGGCLEVQPMAAAVSHPLVPMASRSC